MHLTVLACGRGGTAFVAAVESWRRAEAPSDRLTVVGGTSEEITLYGLRHSPDLDALVEVLRPDAGRPASTAQTGDPTPAAPSSGTGRHPHVVQDELSRWNAAPGRFPIDDLAFARAIARSHWLGTGLTPSGVCARFLDGDPGVRLLPMTDQPVEAHVVVDEGETQRAVHVLEWWADVASTRATGTAVRVAAPGLAYATPAPGVLDAIRSADAVLVPLTAPVTGLGIMLGLPGLRDAVRGTSAPVVGVSPALLPRRGDEEAGLAHLDLHYTSTGVAGLVADLLNGYVVPEADVPAVTGSLSDADVVGVPAAASDSEVAQAALSLAHRCATAAR